ncbi:SRPBCC family protein [Bacillus gobiensis]|uniref:SRPBCC family protein n=1 Tax=Bacillus gobiensis TaxID=1441095 RepID=UPI003D25A66F
MSKRFVTHDTFVIERVYDSPPAQVFSAWADPAAKAKWFTKSDEFDFRVGGRESSRGGPPDGPVYTFDAYYQEIVPDERIVYSYTMDLDETRISVSVTTVEFKPAEGGTQLIFTEQGAFLDGHDSPADREHGTKIMLDKLGEELQKEYSSRSKG